MSRWKRFCAKLFHPREHCYDLRKITKRSRQHSPVPRMIRVNEEEPLHHVCGSISMHCTDNELESLVGLEILEDAWSITHDIASTSSLDYSDTLVDTSSLADDIVREEAVCLGNSTSANRASIASSVESTRITI